MINPSRLLIKGLMLVSLSLVLQSSFAFFVEDPTEWARTSASTNELVQQYHKLQDQYSMMTNQYQQMKEQYSSITGNYGWGNWQNSQRDLTDHEWAAGDWHSALAGMAGGNPARYQQLLNQYKQSHPTLDQNTYQQGTDKGLAANYQQQVQTNQASHTTATYEFNDINKHLQTLYQLGQQIENASKNKDLKSAVDLNSRIELEVAYISTEELRMQTLLNQQMAEQQSSQIAMENEKAIYNQAGTQ